MATFKTKQKHYLKEFETRTETLDKAWMKFTNPNLGYTIFQFD